MITKNATIKQPKQLQLQLPTEQEITRLNQHLDYLKLKAIGGCYEDSSLKATKEGWSYLTFLNQLMEIESNLRQERAIARRIKAARFPVLKTLEQFSWSWPKKINQLQIKDLFRLQFMKQQANIILLGGVGLGKTHIATALGYHACLKGTKVMFVNAIDAINALMIAKKSGKLKLELRKYIKPELLILDELGYLPIDKSGVRIPANLNTYSGPI
jgi:DNA replication protein DnaC